MSNGNEEFRKSYFQLLSIVQNKFKRALNGPEPKYDIWIEVSDTYNFIDVLDRVTIVSPIGASYFQ